METASAVKTQDAEAGERQSIFDVAYYTAVLKESKRSSPRPTATYLAWYLTEINRILPQLSCVPSAGLYCNESIAF